jgi:hypothetical protein
MPPSSYIGGLLSTVRGLDLSNPGSLGGFLARKMDSLLVFQSEFISGSERSLSSCRVSTIAPFWGSLSSLILVGVAFG